MKYKGTLITDASGSLAGLTFSHNFAGAYIRQRVTPTNPNSQYQQTVRGAMTNGHVAWLTLPQGTKDAWNAYAYGTPITDKLGQSIKITGRLMFLRDYVLRKMVGLGLPPLVVTTMGLTPLTPPTVTITSPSTGSIAFTNTDAWCTTTGGWLRAFMSRGKGLGTNFFRGPYRSAMSVEGFTGGPPVSPLAFTTPYAVQVGQKVFMRYLATDKEGRLSQEYFQLVTVS